MDLSNLEGTVLILVALVALVVLALYIWSIVWAYKDAQRRNQYPVLVALMVAFLSWPLGLLVWLIVRR